MLRLEIQFLAWVPRRLL
ncbi:hypothetical protein Prudu_004842 [Prunus dulcis]|uniref:Uncharacterized protein n=1 Tax=Prunus dulcis TaxID=3755 RepID=A0A4Y1QWB4_PRUDU|nr:hypothetical protein Prudu_004842 [Prunus dulcis]